MSLDTPLDFTVNNIPHIFTVYDLQEAVKHGSTGKEPGARVLIKMLGPWKKPKEEKARVGAPVQSERLNQRPDLRSV
jgi:hypothetical protein